MPLMTSGSGPPSSAAEEPAISAERPSWAPLHIDLEQLYCVERGVRQFLDIGSGIPTVGNVHEIAQAMAPECRVLYVDNEPVAGAQRADPARQPARVGPARGTSAIRAQS